MAFYIQDFLDQIQNYILSECLPRMHVVASNNKLQLKYGVYQSANTLAINIGMLAVAMLDSRKEDLLYVIRDDRGAISCKLGATLDSDHSLAHEWNLEQANDKMAQEIAWAMANLAVGKGLVNPLGTDLVCNSCINQLKCLANSV